MNHLCGLPNLKGEGDNAWPKNLTAGERQELAAFRQRYNAALDRARHNDDEEKKESPEPFDATPTYEISDDELDQTGPSGLRPLDDITLYRFLLADRRSDGTFDIEYSHRRLLAACRFRKEHGCDAIVRRLTSNDVPAAVRENWKLRVGIWAGVDRRDRPVVFERFGQFFSSGNVARASPEAWTTSYLYFLETHYYRMRESSRRCGGAVDRIIYLADLQGVVQGILNGKILKVVPLLKSLVQTVECHYPELVDHIVLFNVPRLALGVYKAIRGFLDPVTAQKIELFPGLPYERFKELMSEEVIPVEYGGKNAIDFPQTAAK